MSGVSCTTARGDDDRYTATGSGSKRITWLFGDA